MKKKHKGSGEGLKKTPKPCNMGGVMCETCVYDSLPMFHVPCCDCDGSNMYERDPRIIKEE